MAQPVHSVLFDRSDLYGQNSEAYPMQQPTASGTDGLHFYQNTYEQPTHDGQAYTSTTGGSYYGESPSSYARLPVEGSFWSAFGTGGFPGEPSLLEELGVNFGHIKEKSFTALNPFRTVDRHILDDTDLIGPIIFCLLLGTFKLLSGTLLFGYIYGVAVLGCLAFHAFINLISDTGMDVYRTASVFGYCLLPIVALSGIGTAMALRSAIGVALAAIFVVWAAYAASGMFVTVLDMHHQRWLLGYPLFILYALFALMIVC